MQFATRMSKLENDAQIATAVFGDLQAEKCDPRLQMCGASNESHASFTVAEVTVPKGADWTVGQDHAKWGITMPHRPSCCSGGGNDAGTAAAVRSKAESGHAGVSGANEVVSCDFGMRICFSDLNRWASALLPPLSHPCLSVMMS